jgi:tetratricopeptide (TPR) repeat protein
VVTIAMMFVTWTSNALAQFPENTQPVPATDANQSGVQELEDITLQSLLSRGISRARREDYEGAVADLDEVLKHRPDHAEALYERGEALFNLRQYSSAKKDFAKYVTIKPDDILGWDWLGSAQEETGDLLGAVATYTKQMELEPDSLSAAGLRGDAYRQLGLADEAIADYTKALGPEANDAQDLTYRGLAKLLGTEKPAEALADFNRAIEIDPHVSDDRVYLYRGLAHLRLEQDDQGNADMDKYSDLHPDDEESYDIFINAAFKYITWENPKSAEDYIERGSELEEAEYPQAAVFDYQRAAKLDPQNPDSLYKLGLALRSMGYDEPAVDALKRCVAIDDRYVEALFELGETLRAELDRDAESIPYYEKAIALRPNHGPALGTLGLVKRDTGDKEGALEHLSKALELNPESAFAISERGETYRQLGQLDLALADTTKAVELAPKDAWTLRYRGRVKSALGDFDGAMSDFDAATEVTDLAGLYVDRGITYIRMGKAVEAQAQFDKALERDAALQTEIDAELSRLKELADDE